MLDYIIEKSTIEDVDFIDGEIIKYNLSKVPFTQNPSFISINRIIKGANGEIIAGINSILFGGNMSIFQFLASDKRLMDVKNPYVEVISINEAIKRNIKLSDFIMNSTTIDRDKKSILICDSEEHMNEIEINNDMYYSDEYAKGYSSKENFSQLSWRYIEVRAMQLLNYLKEQLMVSDEIEIWSIFIGEHKPACIKSMSINELSIEDLKFLKGYEKPKCLVINR